MSEMDTEFTVNQLYAEQLNRGVSFLMLSETEQRFFLMGYEIANTSGDCSEVDPDKALTDIVTTRTKEGDPLIEALSLEPAFMFGMRDAVLIRRERAEAKNE